MKYITACLLLIGVAFSAVIALVLSWGIPGPQFNFHTMSADDQLLDSLPTLDSALIADTVLNSNTFGVEPSGAGAQRLAICFRVSGLAPAGGLESWFWTLFGTAWNNDQVTVHAVSLEASHWLPAYFYGAESFLRLQREVPRMNLSPAELQEQCSVILSTEVDPPASLEGTATVPSILIVHAAEDAGTQKHAQYLGRYDAVVCVSPACARTLQASVDAAGVPIHVIPPAIVVDESAISGGPLLRAELHRRFALPSGVQVLGYAGPISPERGVQFFVDVARELPNGWIAIMAGPCSAEGSLPPLHPKVQYLGSLPRATDLLAMVDAVLLPGAEESEPAELLQGWASRVPFFMRRSGLAAAHPAAFVDIGPPGAQSPGQVAAQIASSMHSDESQTVAAAVEAGYTAVTRHYSPGAVSVQYDALLRGAVACASRAGGWLDPRPTAVLSRMSTADTPLAESNALLSLHGKQVQLECGRGGECGFVLSTTAPPPCPNTNFVPKYVRAVFHVFQQNSQLSDEVQVVVRVSFAESVEQGAPEGSSLPAPVPAAVQDGSLIIQQALPPSSINNAVSSAGVARLHVQVPPSTRLHVAQVEWREHSSD